MSYMWPKYDLPGPDVKFPYVWVFSEVESRLVKAKLELDPEDRNIEKFDQEIHKDILCPCMECGTRLKYMPYNEKTGQAEHFKTQNGYKHIQGCEYKPRTYDLTRGPLVKVDMKMLTPPETIETNFSSRSARYHEYNAQHPQLREQFEHLHLKRREKVTTFSADDDLDMIRRIGLDRAQNAVYQIKGDYRILEAQDYFILSSGIKDLFQRLLKEPHNRIPCLIQFSVGKSIESGKAKYADSVVSQECFSHVSYEDGDDPIRHFARPRAIVASGVKIDLRQHFDEAGDYFLKGFIDRGQDIEVRDRNIMIHDLNIEIRNPCQISKKVEIMDFLPVPAKAPERQAILPFAAPNNP